VRNSIIGMVYACLDYEENGHEGRISGNLCDAIQV
jgi:hypothetical protein